MANSEMLRTARSAFGSCVRSTGSATKKGSSEGSGSRSCFDWGRRQTAVASSQKIPVLIPVDMTSDQYPMPVEKDALFWETLLDHKIPKKKLKKKPKLTNAAELALRYDVAKTDVEKVYNIFVSMDDDGSGTISAGEVAKMLAEFGVDVSPKVVQAVMRVSDKSGDGEIDFEEFLAAVTSKIKLNNCKADIHVMFQKFDQNGDGLLSAEELVIAWRETLKTKITVQEATSLIQQADTEGRGAVTISEFITMCQTV